jgi:mannose-1-phosphate guanylyltransferase
MFESYYAVIMAGGSGTRLWPLSRQSRPKQMVSLFGGRTMFQLAIDRLDGLFTPERIYVVTVADQKEALQAQVPQIPDDNYLIEPMPRGTASVVGLAAIAIQKQDPDAVMAILTADHYIQDVDHFQKLLRSAYGLARDEYLVTLGINPTYPATGYGYIEIGGGLREYDGMQSHHALRFLEKPDPEWADQFYNSGKHAWNSGMFVWKVDQIIVEFARQMPQLYAGIQKIGRSWGTAEQSATIETVWQDLEPETIDYGIMEGAENVAVIPVADLGWNDVGSWESLFDVLPQDEHGNVIHQAKHLTLETRNSLVFGNQDERLIVTIGVEDLVIVDTGDVLFVCSKDRAQMVREVVSLLKERNSSYL